MNTPPGSTQENEIDLLRLVGELWDHRKFIISVTALFTLIAVAYSLVCQFNSGSGDRPVRSKSVIY
ncbi:Wzz/FepE/Etk N-terminal domain-containing protein [Escherichia coli]|nr:Wzz/FepE/Etk N-terminal domain-containing protein [Escherichia coli]MDC6784668.1 Wzz/FepE/Etk N-terminal domain-containing protein [Escherichia coli]MDC6834171.1 Wzz/FepE/Etk N-terminal domain-containing protein [Escherichia coli]MDC7010510.1 Wzz/FepE/Etk N-terminal domain-containing protein [Escherichia coli]MDC7065256.1 Wzz/FepE/Etk N-terminal domain-containing protein [Escherichia coli]